MPLDGRSRSHINGGFVRNVYSLCPLPMRRKTVGWFPWSQQMYTICCCLSWSRRRHRLNRHSSCVYSYSSDLMTAWRVLVCSHKRPPWVGRRSCRQHHIDKGFLRCWNCCSVWRYMFPQHWPWQTVVKKTDGRSKYPIWGMACVLIQAGCSVWVCAVHNVLYGIVVRGIVECSTQWSL